MALDCEGRQSMAFSAHERCCASSSEPSHGNDYAHPPYRTMTEILDPRVFSDDPEVLKHCYEERVVGTVSSTWSFLRLSSASNVFAAATAFGRLVDQWDRKINREKEPPGSVLFLLQFNYSLSASGPALAAVLNPVFALEAFLRLVTEVALYDLVEGAPALGLALHGFDSQSFESRLDGCLALIDTPALPGDLRREVGALISFRNSVAHGTPVVHGPGGALLPFKRGQTKLVQAPPEPGSFPHLREDRFPLRMGMLCARQRFTIPSWPTCATMCLVTSPARFIRDPTTACLGSETSVGRTGVTRPEWTRLGVKSWSGQNR
jgi:hypothetical protein